MHTVPTAVLSINPVVPEATIIEQASALLRQGELVVFPTETVYGLGADAMHIQAVEKIFAAKERPLSDPLIVHIADESMLLPLVEQVLACVPELARAFWPGPLTLVLPASARVSRLITAGLPNVAIRMPRHPVARALIRALASPIAAPSANRFMHVSPTTAQHVLADLKGRVPLILDGGPCEVGVESTVLDVTGKIPTVLRPGGVSIEMLRAFLPEIQLAHQPNTATIRADKALTSPGQMPIHYAPHVPTMLFDGSTAAMRTAMLAEVRRRQEQGERVGVLIGDEDKASFEESGAFIYSIGCTLEQVSARLYAGLRTLEDAEVEIILCRSFGRQGLGLAVWDRLRKAAGGHVIELGGE